MSEIKFKSNFQPESIITTFIFQLNLHLCIFVQWLQFHYQIDVEHFHASIPLIVVPLPIQFVALNYAHCADDVTLSIQFRLVRCLIISILARKWETNPIRKPVIY